MEVPELQFAPITCIEMNHARNQFVSNLLPPSKREKDVVGRGVRRKKGNQGGKKTGGKWAQANNYSDRFFAGFFDFFVGFASDCADASFVSNSFNSSSTGRRLPFTACDAKPVTNLSM